MVHNRNTASSFHTVGLTEVDQQFRQWLQNLGVWPDKANRLFMYLAQIPQLPQPISRQHQQMLPEVVQAARHKVKIARRYPAFFRDLLHNAALRQAFMSEVAASNQTPVERKEETPEETPLVSSQKSAAELVEPDFGEISRAVETNGLRQAQASSPPES